MPTSTLMQRLINTLAAKHAMVLTETGAVHRLEIPRKNIQVIRTIGANYSAIALTDSDISVQICREYVFCAAATGWTAIAMAHSTADCCKVARTYDTCPALPTFSPDILFVTESAETWMQ